MKQLIKFIMRCLLTLLSPVMLVFQDDPNVPTRGYGQILKNIWTEDIADEEVQKTIDYIVKLFGDKGRQNDTDKVD